MKQKTPWQRFAGLLERAIRSPKLFWVLLTGFGLQAVWMAVSGAYSMAFDEYYHYGITQLYTHQLSPFFSVEPAHGSFGGLTRDPSYLSHYLLSFPLRIFDHFVPNLMPQVIFLRFIDIALFIGGIIFFRKLFKLIRLSTATNNVVLGFFMAIPVTSFLAAQVNYDDPLFFIAAINFYLAVRLVQTIRKSKRLPLADCLLLLAMLMIAGLIKYPYLPIALAIIGYLAFVVLRTFRRSAKVNAQAVQKSFGNLRSMRGVVICLFFVLSLGLFMERYGLNTIRYHTPTPECNQVLNDVDCLNYDPYARNKHYADLNLRSIVSNYDKVTYPGNWSQAMLRSMIFSVGPKQLNYPAGEPLPAAYVAAYVVAIGGIVAIVWRFKYLWFRSTEQHIWRLFFIVIGLYGATLFAQNLADFLHLGVSVAIQGRYLVVILPLALTLVAVSARDVLRRFRPRVMAACLLVLAVLMLQGGGIMPFIIRSADSWMWNNPTTVKTNRVIRSALWHEVIR